MARTKNQKNGRLEEALATLIQNQAAFVAQLRERDREMIDFQRRFDQIDQRFANIEALLREHTRILNEHSQALERLPDAVRDRIGFK